MRALAKAKFTGVLSRPFLGLALITVASLVVRLVAIDRWPLWGDEGLTLLIVQWPAHYLFLAPLDPTPGLYYALHKVFLGPMTDAATARYVSLACGTLLIPAIYILAKQARIPALLSAALVALSFPLIDYSQEARAYSLLVLLVTCSATAFVRWTRSRQQRQLLIALLFGILSFYTHMVSIFWLGPMCLAIAWLGRREAFLPLMLVAVLAVPEISRLIAYNHGIFSWLAQATSVEAGNTLSRALLPFRPEGVWAALIVVPIAWRAWAHRQDLTRWAKDNPGAAYALAALIGSPLLIWAFGLVAKPIFMTRTILIGVPGFMLGLALLLRFEHRLVRFGMVALYAGSLLVTGTTRQKDDWRAIAARVGDDAVLMCQLWQASAMRHALPHDNPVLLRYDQGVIEVWGSPWQRSYFEILSKKKRVDEAKRRGAAVDLDSFPVWPVRSGQIEQMAVKPTTLRQAIALCDSVRAADREPRYIAD